MKRLGFIGLGLMGEPMAKNLVAARYELTVHDINPQPVKRLVDLGARKASSPKEVAENSDIILTMLPNGPEVKEVVLGEKGVIEGVRRGQILIDMSSIAPLVSQEVAKNLADKGVSTLDAPVSGGVEKRNLAPSLLWWVVRNQHLKNARKFLM